MASLPSLTCPMKESITDLLNNKAAEEMAASHAYLAAAFWFKQQNYDGISKFLHKESLSEREHALMLYAYIHKRGGVAKALAVPEVDTSAWKKPSEVMKALLEQEIQVAESLKRLSDAAIQAQDHMTVAAVHEFHVLQTDEIDEMSQLYTKTQAYEALPGLMYHLDAELS